MRGRVTHESPLQHSAYIGSSVLMNAGGVLAQSQRKTDRCDK